MLSLPGWTNSGPQHWQTLWERLDPRITRVEQASWDFPELADWRARALEAITSSAEPTVLVGHSLGAILIAHLAEHAPRNVVGALLVAPPDLEAPTAPTEVRGFRATFAKLPFPATLIVSSDDQYSSLAASRRLGATLGAELVEAGPKGHLNTDSRLGTWGFGWERLRRLRALAPFAIDPRLEADSVLIARSALCELRVVDDARVPWFLLVPRRSAVEELDQLSEPDRQALIDESAALTRAVRECFAVDKVNVGALGNIVRQLHLHHLGRGLLDPAWPAPFWGHGSAVRDRPLALRRAATLLEHPAVHARFARQR